MPGTSCGWLAFTQETIASTRDIRVCRCPPLDALEDLAAPPIDRPDGREVVHARTQTFCHEFTSQAQEPVWVGRGDDHFAQAGHDGPIPPCSCFSRAMTARCGPGRWRATRSPASACGRGRAGSGRGVGLDAGTAGYHGCEFRPRAGVSYPQPLGGGVFADAPAGDTPDDGVPAGEAARCRGTETSGVAAPLLEEFQRYRCGRVRPDRDGLAGGLLGIGRQAGRAVWQGGLGGPVNVEQELRSMWR